MVVLRKLLSENCNSKVKSAYKYATNDEATLENNSQCIVSIFQI